MKCLMMVFLVLLFACSFVSVGQASCGDCEKQNEGVGAFYRLECDVPSLYLLNGMNMSVDQYKKLSALVEKAKQVEEHYGERYARTAKRSAKDFGREMDDILKLATKGKSANKSKMPLTPRETERGKARSELWKIQSKQNEEIDKLIDKTYDLLTEGQRNVLDSFLPCFVPPSDFRNPDRVGQVKGNASIVEKEMDNIRNSKYEDGSRRRALSAIVMHVMKNRHINYSKMAEQEVSNEISMKLDPILKKMKSMSAEEYSLQKKRMASSVAPPEPDDPDACRSKIKRYVLNTDIRDIIKARANGSIKVGALPSPRSGNGCGTADKSKALRMAAILSRLDLTSEQAGKLADIVSRALVVKDEMGHEMAEVMEDAFEPYCKLRTELAAGFPDKKLESNALKYHGKVKDLRDDKLKKQLLEIEKSIDQYLTASQIEFLSSDMDVIMKSGSSSEPCTDDGMEKVVRRSKRLIAEVRRLSAMSFAKKKDELAREFVKECIDNFWVSKKGIDIDSEVKRGAEILEKVKKMSRTDYSSQRDDLAMELCPRRKDARDAYYGNRYKHGKPHQELSPSTAVLFTETAHNVLEKMAGK